MGCRHHSESQPLQRLRTAHLCATKRRRRMRATLPSQEGGAAVMSNRSKQKGTTFESAVVAYLQASGWPGAERRALHGSQDKGDILGVPGWVLECKNASRIELGEWVKELQAEIRNAGAAHGALWLKRRGKSSPADSYVVIDGQTFIALLKAGGW
jgi:hypothetical protein